MKIVFKSSLSLLLYPTLLLPKARTIFTTLQQFVGSLPHQSEIDAPLVYADYYYMEALLRYLQLQKSGKLFVNN